MAPTKKVAPPSKVVQIKEGTKAVLDAVFSRVVSRKLAVWIAATYALSVGVLESGDWVAVSLAYIGSQAAVDLASKWKSS